MEIVIAAADTHPQLKELAGFICEGHDDQLTFMAACDAG
jgi:hypothetical protein